MFAVDTPFRQFVDLNGAPLDGGSIYYGEPNKDPEAYPLSVYWDAGKTQAVTQPVNTVMGYVLHNNKPANVFSDGDYSITVRNKYGQLVYSSPSAVNFSQQSAPISQNNGPAVLVSQFGAQKGQDATAAFIAAATFLLKQPSPGGTILVDGEYTVTAAPGGGVNFWNILCQQQGITVSDGYLPNGELVRGVAIHLQGYGFDCSKINVVGSGDAFVWGKFTSISSKRAMSGSARGIYFRGPGAVGHTSQVIIPGAQGFSTTSTSSAGTTNTTTRCLVFEECVPGTVIENNRFRYFQEAVHQVYGFGLVADGNGIQYCNIGVFFDAGVTTWEVRSGNEIEVCAVGVYSKNTANGKICAAVIEANLAGCDVLVWCSKFLTIDGLWNEGSVQNMVFRADMTAPSLPNSGITIRKAIGLNVNSNGGLINFRAVECAMNTLGESFTLNPGERFENNVYDNCTFNEGPFSMSSITLNGAPMSGIRVLGRVANTKLEDFPMRDPLTTRGIIRSTSLTAVKGFSVSVLNENTTARLEITAYKKSAPGNNMRMQTMHYVGVIQRAANQSAVVQFSPSESAVSEYASTGANPPITVSLPAVTSSGAATTTQTLDFLFPTGTAVGSTADTFFEARIFNESSAIAFA